MTNFITTQDGTNLYYKDWGQGRPVVFSHGWPLSSDAWEAQMVFLAEKGYRVIAHDRRGHGRSGQPWQGNDMDTFADDLEDLLKKLNVKDVTLVGHSMGGGEIARYMRRHGTKRVAQAVFIAAVPPYMLKSAKNPDGIDKEVFDDMREKVKADRSQFYQEFSSPFYNFNRLTTRKHQSIMDGFWFQAMQGSLKSHWECIEQFSETNFMEDLKKIDVPTLFLHGDDDQIVPLKASSALAEKLVPNSKLKVYEGGSHGLCVTSADQVNKDLLDFLKMVS